MSDQEKMEVIFKNLSDAVNSHRSNSISLAAGDCVGDCGKAFETCSATAGSVLEKAVCNSAYMKCIANC